VSDIQTALEDAMISGATISEILTDDTLTGDQKAVRANLILKRMIPDEALLRKLQTCAYNHLAEPRERRLERLVSDIYHSRYFDGDAALEDEDLDLVSRMRHEIK
jgi:hypothetical protein